MFVTAAACKDTMLIMGYRVYCREGVSLGSNSEASPAPMLLSNSLFLMFAPQMMARITMNRDSADLGRDNDTGRKQLASSL